MSGVSGPKKRPGKSLSDEDVRAALLKMANAAAEAATKRIEAGKFSPDEVHILCTAASTAYAAAKSA